ncbi:MAG TPA: TonB-dependent receptor [Acetobacteraceae bacterium]|nr:TonB-dependent receptor [Acetobacteraceae bacterium]
MRLARRRFHPRTCARQAAAAVLCMAILAPADVALAQHPHEQIEQVIVTARRRAERQQRVPTAITAFSGKELQRKGVVNTNDLARAVPNLSIGGQTRSDSQFYLRGQTPGIINQGVHNNSSVTIYFLEVPTLTSGPGEFYDMADVQVLKGPQGTLFGRNTTGGAILFTPARPRDDYEGYIQGRLGNYNDRELEGALNFPLVPDKLDLRVSGATARRDGFTTNIDTGEKLDDRDYDAYRVSLDAHINDSLDNLLVIDGRMINQNGTSSIPLEFNPDVVLKEGVIPGTNIPLTFGGTGPSVFCLEGYGPKSAGGLGITTPIPGCPSGLIQTYEAALKANDVSYYSNALLHQLLALQRSLGPRQFASDANYFDQERSFDATDITTWNINDDLTLKNIFGYRFERRNQAEDFAGTVLPLVRSTNTQGDWGEDALQQLSEELQLQGVAFNDKLHYIIGTYLENADPGQPTISRALEFGPPPSLKSLPELYNPLTVSSSIIDYHKFNDKSESVFLHGEYNLGDLLPGLKASAGLRYSWDERQASINQLNSVGQCVARTQIYAVNGRPICFDSEHAEFTAPTWSATLSEQFDPKTLAYITLRRGYKTGGFNLPAPRDLAGNVFDQSFQPEYVFDTEIGLKKDWMLWDSPMRTNIALFHDVYSSIQASFATVAGGTIASVVQNAGRAHIDGMELEHTALITPNFQVSGYFSLLRAVFSTPFLQEGINLKGTQLFYSPIQKYGITGIYTLPLPERLGSLGITGDFSLSTHYTIADPLDPMAYFKGQENLNVRVDWNRFLGKPLDFSFIMTNALNKTYPVGGYPIYGLAGFRADIYDEPRMVVGQVTIHWGPGMHW